MNNKIDIKLVPMENTMVLTRTLSQFRLILRLYEAAGWTVSFATGDTIGTSYHWGFFKEYTAVDVGFNPVFGEGTYWYYNSESKFDREIEFIEFDKFLDTQNVNLEGLAEILRDKSIV